MFFSCACKLQAPWVSSPNEDDFGLQTNHRDEIQLHKFVILKHRGMQFTTWTFFNLINICIKGEGQIHPLAVWRFLFSAWETCSFPSFLSPCCLDTAASELVLISPRCDSSLALHGTGDSFNSYFPPAVSCRIRLLCLGEGGVLSQRLLFLWSYSTWGTVELLLGFLTTQLSLLMDPAMSTLSCWWHRFVAMEIVVLSQIQPSDFTAGSCRRNGQGFRENLIKTESCQFWTVER